MSRIVNRHIEVIVASFGGVGTTFLMEFISRYKTTNHPLDRDGLKHIAVPPVPLNPDCKIIYVYGDPLMACVSLFRRGYHASQSRKIQRLRGVKVRPITQTSTLDKYVARGEDRLLFEEHFMSWRHRFLLNDSLFIKYNSIWDHVPEILEFLDIPESESQYFPERKARNSSLEQLSPEILQGLKEMYASFSARINTLPDCERVSVDRNSYLRHVISSSNLRMAFSLKGFAESFKYGCSMMLEKYSPACRDKIVKKIKARY